MKLTVRCLSPIKIDGDGVGAALKSTQLIMSGSGAILSFNLEKGVSECHGTEKDNGG